MRLEDALLVVLGIALGVAVTLLARGLAGPRSSAAPATAQAMAAGDGDDVPGLLDEIETGIIVLDRDQRVAAVNEAGARLLELDRERARGRTLMETFVDHQVEEAARAALARGAETVEIVRAAPDDRRLLVRLKAAPTGRLWLFVDDVTELRRLQRIRSEFIDNLSHELRTPLTTIRLLTEILTQDAARPEAGVPARVRERIEKIDVETGHLAQMVTELLDLSRIEGGAEDLHLAEVRPVDVVTGAVDRLRTFADRQGVRLESEVDEGLPPMRADQARIGQVLLNLLHNAIKFSPPGAVVTVSARVEDEAVAITVRDEGPGIASQDRERVFERFYKVDKARQRGQGGTGLGLAIARHIVGGHGGRIWVESEEGHGSAFTFTVPLATRRGR